MTHLAAKALATAALGIAFAGTVALVQAQTLHVAQSQPVAQAARGELLYQTHCVACHTAQIHWRAKKRVTDWGTLTAEVRRWAANAGLGWSDDEVVDVARYLDVTIYRLPVAPKTGLRWRSPAPAPAGYG